MLFKYDIVSEVTIAGEKVGYVSDKNEFEEQINEMVNKEEEGKLYTTIEDMPEYTLTLIDKTEQTNEEEILTKLEEDSETTYKLYAVTIDGEEEAILANLDDAEDLVDEMTEEYEDDIKLDIGITDVVTTDKEDEDTVKGATEVVDEILTAQVEEKEEEEAKKAKEAEEKAEAEKAQAEEEAHSVEGVYLSVTPVSGVITSRFGSTESIRSSGHTGLDIAAAYGTSIKAAAGGTVIFAGYSGGYGNVVKISHGNGVQTYYGHCSKLYVSTGDTVSAGDVIAAVGSTGNSTGNHLHFEVRVNGEEVNPQNYLY